MVVQKSPFYWHQGVLNLHYPGTSQIVALPVFVGCIHKFKSLETHADCFSFYWNV